MIKKLVGALFIIWIGAVALADTRAPMSTVATEGECTAETLRQLERDWADAEEADDSVGGKRGTRTLDPGILSRVIGSN